MTETPRRRPLAVLVLVVGLLSGVVAMHAADGGLHASHVATAAPDAHDGAPAHADEATDSPAGQHGGMTTAVLVCLAVLTALALALATRRGPVVLVPAALRSVSCAGPARTRRPPPDLALLCVLRT